MATPHRLVVVGASLAGVNAVQAVRAEGYDGELVLVGAEATPPYDRPPLSKAALSGGTARTALRPPEFYRDNDVRLVLGRTAVRLDADRRAVELDNGQRVGYGRLLIATGATPRLMRPMPPGAHALRTLEDCHALRDRLRPGRRLAVVGAGFIGLEVAATARALGVDVVVLETADAPLAQVLGPDVGAWLRDLHRRHGIDIRCNTGVEAVDGEPGALKLRCANGSVLSADLVVVGIGVSANTGWLRGSGVRVGDGVLCDEYCQTNVPGIAAAGDVARWYNPLFDEQMRIEHWTNAVEQGRRAALNLLAEGERVPYRPVPYFWSDQFSAKIRFVGRSFAAEESAVVERDDTRGSLVVLYRRDGCVRGALTVNAPRAAATYRALIAKRAPWAEAVSR